jgi:hypothetical protein
MSSPTDTFVRAILEDSPSPRDSGLSRQLISASESMRTIPESPNSRTRLLEKSDESPLLPPHPGSHHAMRRAQSLFRYSLIFINFTFIVAAMLLIMAGVVARENSAVKLCNHCGDLTLVAIVFGIALWLFAIFGFNWIRQRNILLLLVYVAFLVLQSVVLFAVIITAGVFDANTASSANDDTPFLQQWEASVNVSVGESPLCDLQRQFNCSGYKFGCCAPGICYNATHPEPWVSAVCPLCNATAAPQVCTDIVYDTLRKNLGGFLVISCFSMLLVLSGILLAFLARKVNQSVARSAAPTPSAS